MNVCSLRNQMESEKPEPVSHPVPGKSEPVSNPIPGKPESVSHPVPKHAETDSHLELEESENDTASESSQSSSRENTSNLHKDTTSGDASADKPAPPPGESPPRSSISSDVSNLTHGSAPKASISPPAPVDKDPAPPAPAVEVKKSVKNESLALVKVDHVFTDVASSVGVDGGRDGGGGGAETRRRLRQRLSSLKSSQGENMVKKAALGFRVFGFLFCLVSFSVMVADRKQGWAIDSFQRYKEFRYSMSVNVIGFAYSGAQAIDLIYHSSTKNNFFQHPLRHYFDFAIDQAMTYLLISASSSAATRVDDWRLNFGKDKFPDMASASVSMSFLAFVALAFSSLISGYTLCYSGSSHS